MIQFLAFSCDNVYCGFLNTINQFCFIKMVNFYLLSDKVHFETPSCFQFPPFEYVLCVWNLKLTAVFTWHEDCVDGISSPSLDMSNSVVIEISFCGPHCYRSVVAFAMAFRKYYTRNSLSTDIMSLIELRRISAIFVHECQFSYFVVCVSCDKMRCICILCFRNQKFQASAPSSIEYDYEYH